MANVIKPKRSYSTGNTPSLSAGELAIQAADFKVFLGNSTGTGSILIASRALSDMTGTTDNITQGSTNKYYADSLARAALSSSATGLTYTSSTGAFSLTSGYSIPTTSDQTNWTTAYTNRITSLTTTGSSGAATLTSNTLNIPTYTLAGLGGQASSTNLTSLAGLTYSSASFVKMTASGTFSLDTSTYLTANQSITLSGDVSGSGSTSISVTLETVGATKGGTGQTTYTLGDILYSSAANTLAKLSGNTTTTKQFLSQTGTGTASAAPAWSAVSKSDVGLGSVENTAISTWAGSTNVTTLGTVATGTWSGTAIGLSKGGTNANLTAANGGIVYSDASALAILAAGTSGQLLQSNGAAAPSWVASPSVPTGSLFPYAGSSAPTGYLLCNGAAVSRSTYATLFGILSTTYGAGDGSTTFNVPDLRGRFPMGAGTGTGLNASGTGLPSGTAQTARTAGQWGGEETHQLTTAELASHTHANTVSGGSTGSMSANSAHGHLQANKQGTTGGQYGLVDSGNSGSSGQPYTATVNTDHTHTFTPSISNASSGSDSRHNTIPPFVVLNYIIKT